MPHILVIDDEIEICRLIERTLKKEGYQVTVKSNALKLCKENLNDYDLILLDVMMPEMDGFTFCRQVRQEVDCPILFLTAKTMDEDLLYGFSSGADDYIKKPFSLIELRARVSAHLRREHREHRQILTLGDFRFTLSSRELSVSGQILPLTKSEYDICEYLARHKGSVFTLEQILEAVLGYDSNSDISAIRVHIKNIRSKLSKYAESPIETVWGVGYKWK